MPTAFIAFHYRFATKDDIIKFFMEINNIRNKYLEDTEYSIVCVTRIIPGYRSDFITMIAKGSMSFIDEIINLIKEKYDKEVDYEIIE